MQLLALLHEQNQTVVFTFVTANLDQRNFLAEV